MFSSRPYLTSSQLDLTTPQLAVRQQNNPHNADMAAELTQRLDATPEMLHRLIHNPPVNAKHWEAMSEEFWAELAANPNLTEPLMEQLIQISNMGAVGLTANPKTPTRLLEKILHKPGITSIGGWEQIRLGDNLVYHQNATTEILLLLTQNPEILDDSTFNVIITHPNTTLEVLEALTPLIQGPLGFPRTITTLAEALTKHPKYSTYPKEWVEELLRPSQ